MLIYIWVVKRRLYGVLTTCFFLLVLFLLLVCGFVNSVIMLNIPFVLKQRQSLTIESVVLYSFLFHSRSRRDWDEKRKNGKVVAVYFDFMSRELNGAGIVWRGSMLDTKEISSMRNYRRGQDDCDRVVSYNSLKYYTLYIARNIYIKN